MTNFRVAGLVCLVWLAGRLASTCYLGLYLFFGIYICDLFCILCIVFAVSLLELRLHQTTVSMDSGCSCSCSDFLMDKIALLERRICQLEEERVASIKKTDTPESIE